MGRSNRYGIPHAGTGPPPAILADDPAHLGNRDFRLGVGAGPADGYGTVHLALPGDPLFVGVTFFAQWFVEDAGAIGGFSATRGAVVTLF